MNLDFQQQAAVMTDSPRVVCLAGAGSGKTRIIVERIARLIENKKVSPYEIMAVSFTRKASKELKKRLEERIGRGAHHITCGTIHSIALRFLKRFGDLVGLRGQSLTIYSDFEENYLLKECAIELGIYKGKAWKIPKGDILAVFEAYYQEGVVPSVDHPGLGIFNEFIARCHENNSLTYGALMVGLRELLPHIAKFLTLKYIFVDEVQDIDTLQWSIFNTLAELCHADLFVVGDIDQSIYEWRGARPGYLVEHQNDFQVFKVENNYRSSTLIVDAANHLIEHNQMRIERTMRPARLETGHVLHSFDCDTDRIAALISTIAEKRIGKGAFAVLSRNHILLRKLAIMLEVIRLPYTYVGRKTELIESAPFRIFHAFLKLLVNEFDNFSFLLVREPIGLDRPHYNEIRLRSTQEARSHFQTWKAEEAPKNRSDFFDWFDLAKTDWTLPDSVRNLFGLWRKAGIDPLVMREISEFIEEWIKENPDAGTADYLEWLATYDLQDEIEEADERVKIMTIHAAKGLEWPTVMVIGCNEGILPSKQSVEANDIEPERRLMYVAITRAKDELILAIRPERKEVGDKLYENPISRFVSETLI